MSVSMTSKLAFKKLNDTSLSKQQNQVFQTLIPMASASNKLLARKLEWDIGTVAGRINELHKKRLIDFKIGKCPITGSTVKLWSVIEYLQSYSMGLTTKPRPPKISSTQAAML